MNFSHHRLTFCPFAKMLRSAVPTGIKTAQSNIFVFGKVNLSRQEIANYKGNQRDSGQRKVEKAKVILSWGSPTISRIVAVPAMDSCMLYRKFSFFLAGVD